MAAAYALESAADDPRPDPDGTLPSTYMDTGEVPILSEMYLIWGLMLYGVAACPLTL